MSRTYNNIIKKMEHFSLSQTKYLTELNFVKHFFINNIVSDIFSNKVIIMNKNLQPFFIFALEIAT